MCVAIIYVCPNCFSVGLVVSVGLLVEMSLLYRLCVCEVVELFVTILGLSMGYNFCCNCFLSMQPL